MIVLQNQPEPSLVWLGDSITRAWRNGGRHVWAAHYAGRNAINLGVSGDRIEDLSNKLDRGLLVGLCPRLVVLHIGTNDLETASPKDVANGIADIVFRILAMAPSVQILLHEIFPRGACPHNPIREAVNQANEILRTVVFGPRVRICSVHVELLDEQDVLTRVVSPDGLHLSSEGYSRWARAIEPEIMRFFPAGLNYYVEKALVPMSSRENVRVFTGRQVRRA